MKIVEVTNRNNGYTGYYIPDTNRKRNFAPGETKKIDLEELIQLSYIDGGEYLLKNYFIIDNKDALSQLNLAVEPEYFYTEKEIRDILFNGSLDQLEDTLNFAPNGVIELIKQIAVKEELPDTRKRKLISEKTGFNIDSAIYVNSVMNEDDNTEAETETKTRKVAIEGAPTRKATIPADKYKVVSTTK